LFKKKKTKEEVFNCVICQEPAVLKDGTPEPPGILKVNEHTQPLAEVPYYLSLCAECLDKLSEYILFAVEEQENAKKEKEVMDKLIKLDVGTILTVVEEDLHALPNDKMKQVLDQTPFSHIWKQGL
jgi:hypothetical protein